MMRTFLTFTILFYLISLSVSTPFDDWVAALTTDGVDPPAGYTNVNARGVGTSSLKMDFGFSLHPDQFHVNVHIEKTRSGTVELKFLHDADKVNTEVTRPLRVLLHQRVKSRAERLTEQKLTAMKGKLSGSLVEIDFDPSDNEGVVGLIAGNKYMFSGAHPPTSGFGTIVMNHVMALLEKWIDPTKKGTLYLADDSQRHIGGAWWDDNAKYSLRLLRAFEGYEDQKPLSWYEKWNFVPADQETGANIRGMAAMIRKLKMSQLKTNSKETGRFRLYTQLENKGLSFSPGDLLGHAMKNLNREDAAKYVEVVKLLLLWSKYYYKDLYTAMDNIRMGYEEMIRVYPVSERDTARVFEGEVYDNHEYDWDEFESQLLDMYLDGYVDERSLMRMLNRGRN